MDHGDDGLPGSDEDWHPNSEQYGGGGDDPWCEENVDCKMLTDEDMVNGASLAPGGETIDDFLTAITGCGLSCRAGYEEKVGGFWRFISFASLIGPWGGRSIRLAADQAGGWIRKTIQVTDKARTLDQFLDDAIGFLGEGYNQITSGIYESMDGLRRVRFRDSDIAGTRSPVGPHGHFEILDTIGDVIKNIHIPFLGDN